MDVKSTYNTRIDKKRRMRPFRGGVRCARFGCMLKSTCRTKDAEPAAHRSAAHRPAVPAKERMTGMDHRKLGETYYVRMDRGDEIVSSLLDLCRREGIRSACYSGIGGCSSAQMQTFIPERGEFETETVEGMLELVSLMGNIISGDAGELFHHTHAAFSYMQDGVHRMTAGHLKASTVLYTAEIELRPVRGGEIRRQFDPETGTGFWKF